MLNSTRAGSRVKEEYGTENVIGWRMRPISAVSVVNRPTRTLSEADGICSLGSRPAAGNRIGTAVLIQFALQLGATAEYLGVLVSELALVNTSGGHGSSWIVTQWFAIASEASPFDRYQNCTGYREPRCAAFWKVLIKEAGLNEVMLFWVAIIVCAAVVLYLIWVRQHDRE